MSYGPYPEIVLGKYIFVYAFLLRKFNKRSAGRS